MACWWNCPSSGYCHRSRNTGSSCPASGSTRGRDGSSGGADSFDTTLCPDAEKPAGSCVWCGASGGDAHGGDRCRGEGARPLAVVHAEVVVVEADGVPSLVLLPEELKGDAGVPELLVDDGPAWQGSLLSRGAAGIDRNLRPRWAGIRSIFVGKTCGV